MVPLRHLETASACEPVRSSSPRGEDGRDRRLRGTGRWRHGGGLHAAQDGVPQYLATCAPRHGSVQIILGPSRLQRSAESLRQFKKVWAPKVDPHQDCSGGSLEAHQEQRGIRLSLMIQVNFAGSQNTTAVSGCAVPGSLAILFVHLCLPLGFARPEPPLLPPFSTISESGRSFSVCDERAVTMETE